MGYRWIVPFMLVSALLAGAKTVWAEGLTQADRALLAQLVSRVERLETRVNQLDGRMDVSLARAREEAGEDRSSIDWLWLGYGGGLAGCLALALWGWRTASWEKAGVWTARRKRGASPVNPTARGGGSRNGAKIPKRRINDFSTGYPQRRIDP